MVELTWRRQEIYEEPKHESFLTSANFKSRYGPHSWQSLLQRVISEAKLVILFVLFYSIRYIIKFIRGIK
jgi:hypothetical protein